MGGGKPIELLKQGGMGTYGLCKRFIFAVITSVVMLAPMAGIANEEAAEVAYSEAVELIEQARRTESLGEQWTFYESARETMSQILSSLPGTELGRRMWDDDTLEGSLYAETKRAVLETGKAVCGQDFTAACVLRYARNAILIVDGASSDNYLMKIALAQASIGDIAGAFVSIESVHSLTYREVLPTIMAAMVAAGNLEGALTRARANLRRQDRDLALLSVVRALAVDQDVLNGRLIAAEIESAAEQSLALAAMAGADPTPERAAEWEALFADAVSLAKGIADASKRTTVLFEIAAHQLGVGEHGFARQTIVLALAAAQAITDIYDRSYVMSVAMGPFETAQKTDADQAVINELRSAMVNIDESRTPIENFLDAAKLKFGAGDLAGAITILDQGRDMALTSESEEDRGYFLVRIIADRSEMGDIDGALADWALMPDGAYESGWRDIAVAQAKVGDIDGVKKLLMANGGSSSNEPELAYMIIPALAQNGYFSYAHYFAASLDIDYIHYEEAMIEIAKGEASAGKFHAALAAAGSIGGRDARARAISEIAAAHFSMGRLDEANRHLKIAFQEMFGPGGILSVTNSSYSRSLYDLNVFDWQAFHKIGQVLGEIEASG